MFGDRGSSRSGAAVRVGTRRDAKKRKILLDREEFLAIERYAQVLNGREDVIISFFEGFRRKFFHSGIIDVATMKEVLKCVRGEESEVALDLERPPSSVFHLPLNKD